MTQNGTQSYGTRSYGFLNESFVINEKNDPEFGKNYTDFAYQPIGKNIIERRIKDLFWYRINFDAELISIQNNINFDTILIQN